MATNRLTFPEAITRLALFDKTPAQTCKQFSVGSGYLAIVVGALSLVGWSIGIEALKDVSPGLASMKPLTAVALILCGIGLVGFHSGNGNTLGERKWPKYAKETAGALASLIGMLTLAEYCFDANLGIDDLLFHKAVWSESGAFPGRISEATALSLVLLGWALVLLGRRAPFRTLAPVFGLLAATIGLLAMSGYLYGVTSLYRVGAYSTTALHTSAIILILGAGIVLAQPEQHLGGILASDLLGGKLARRAFPLMLVLPALIGWIRWQGQRAGLYGTEFGLALFTVSQVLVLTTFLGVCAKWLNRIDGERMVEFRRSLRQSRIVECSMDAIVSVDKTQRITIFNPAAEKMFGVRAEEAIGKPLQTMIPARFRSTHEAYIREFGTSNQTRRGMGELGKVYGLRADGSEFPIEASISHSELEGEKAFTAILRDMTVRQKAEEGLARLAAIVECSDDAIVGKTLDGMILSWNEGAERVFGYTAEEAIGKSMGMVIPPERIHEEMEILEKIARGETVRHFETVRMRKDGTRINASVTISPLRDARGRITGASKILRDITERVRTDEERRKQVLLLSHAPVMILSKDGCIQFWGRGLEELYGYAEKDAIGRISHDLLKTVFPELREAVVRTLLERGSWRGELVHTRADGTTAVVASHWILFRNADGTPGEILEVNADITQLRTSERKTLEQLQRLSLLSQVTRAIGDRLDEDSILDVVLGSLEQDLAADFVCMLAYDPVDLQLCVVRTGGKSVEQAERMGLRRGKRFDLDSNGLRRSVSGELVYERDTEQVNSPFAQELARTDLRSLVIAPLQTEGTVYHILVAARRAPEAFSSGECEFLRQLCEHAALATHQAQLYEALQKAYEELRTTQQAVLQQERLRALGQMASGVAHDINNAISPVAIYAESILETEPELSEKTRKRLEIMRRAIQDVAHTISRMREFYREREAAGRLTSTEINAMVEQVIELTRARWSDIPQQRGFVIELRTEFTAGLPSVRGVESEIRDALTNLVFNAVDAMQEGGILTFRTLLDKGPETSSGKANFQCVVIEVSDTGCGMDEETRRRCLEPFFTTKGERGTGLGLAMVFGMVQRHNAELEIDSRPGGGTTVRLRFQVPTGTPADGRKQEVLRGPTVRLRLLIVDDDPILLNSLREILVSDGHSVEAADGGAAGINSFRTAMGRGQPFDAVITDLGMPHVSGREVATAVKQNAPNTPVLLLTGWGKQLSADAGLPLHVDRVLSKPPKLQELRDALAEHCTEHVQQNSIGA